MRNYTIEIFLPVAENGIPETVKPFLNHSSVTNIWLLSPSHVDIVLPPKVRLLPVDSLSSTTTFKKLADVSSADYQLFIAKDGVAVDETMLEAMCEQMPQDASMAYSYYRKVLDGECVDAPTI